MIRTPAFRRPIRQAKTSIEFFKYADKFRTVPAGTLIFREGTVGGCMYVIKSGTVDLYVGDKLVERVEAGQIFGEMALLDNPVRSASAIAVTNCHLVPMDQETFDRLISTSPYFAKEVLQIMAARLRRLDCEAREMYERERRVREALQ